MAEYACAVNLGVDSINQSLVSCCKKGNEKKRKEKKRLLDVQKGGEKEGFID